MRHPAMGLVDSSSSLPSLVYIKTRSWSILVLNHSSGYILMIMGDKYILFLTKPEVSVSGLDLNALADCFLESFAIISPRRVVQPKPETNFVGIDMSVDAAEVGLLFADKVINLSDSIRRHQATIEDLGQPLDDMLQLAKEARLQVFNVKYLLIWTKYELEALEGKSPQPNIKRVLDTRVGVDETEEQETDNIMARLPLALHYVRQFDSFLSFAADWWSRMELVLAFFQKSTWTRKSLLVSTLCQAAVRQRWVRIKDNHKHQVDKIRDYLPMPMVEHGIRFTQFLRDGVYGHLTNTIFQALSAANPLIDRNGWEARKLRQRMAVLNPVDSLMYGNEYRRKLLKLSSGIPIHKHALYEALAKDRHTILVLLSRVMNSEHDKKVALTLRGDDARRFVDVIESVVDGPGTRASDRMLSRQAFRFLVKVCRMSQQLPTSINIGGVTLQDRQPPCGGGFADIYHASYLGADVAVKRLRVFERDQERKSIHQAICREALAWRRLRHPFVLPFLGINSEIFPPFLCMISPWMENGTIAKHPALSDGRLDVVQVLSEVAQGLEYIHSENTIHGDLRGGNILIDDDWHVRLADFGLAVFSDATAATRTSNSNGTIRWMAPELHEPESFGMERSQRTYATDVYAFACVCVELYVGRHPFYYISNDTTVLLKVIKGERPLRPCGEPGKAMPDNMWYLVEQCWQEQISGRPTMSEVVRVMKEWAVGV